MRAESSCTPLYQHYHLQHLSHSIPLLMFHSGERRYGRSPRKMQLGLQSLYVGYTTTSDQFRQASQPVSKCASSNGKQMDSPPTTVTARESSHLPYSGSKTCTEGPNTGRPSSHREGELLTRVTDGLVHINNFPSYWEF